MGLEDTGRLTVSGPSRASSWKTNHINT